MILPLLVMLSFAGFALAAIVPVATGAARQGRQAAWQLKADAAAAAGLAEAEGGAWVSMAMTTLPGAVLPLAPLLPRPNLTVGRVARRIDGSLWLIQVTAELVGGAGLGGRLAWSEQGLLVRLEVPPGDSVMRVRPTTRPWVRRPQ